MDEKRRQQKLQKKKQRHKKLANSSLLAQRGNNPKTIIAKARNFPLQECLINTGCQIEYGKNGKPFFVAGPDDNVELIMRKLAGKLG